MSVIRTPKRKIVSCQKCKHVKNKPSGEFCQRMFLYTAGLKLPKCPYFQKSQAEQKKANSQHSKEKKRLEGVCRNWLEGKCHHYNIKIGQNHTKCPNYREKGKRGDG